MQRAKQHGDRLVVGVSSDALNFSKKSRNPVYSELERTSIIAALSCVDEVFIEESLELKGEYIQKHKADILIMGDDWAGRFDIFKELCEVLYLPRTEGISTTQLIKEIKAYGENIINSSVINANPV